MSNRKAVTDSRSQKKQRKLTPLQIGGIFSLVLAVCCLSSIGISLIGDGKSTQTQVADLLLPTQALTEAPSRTPKFTAEPQSTVTPIPPTALIPIPSTEIVATVSVSTNMPVVLGGGNSLRVHFIDVGQGDAILIEAPSGEVGLIDGGETSTGVVQYLQAVGITRLNFILATHPHSDHIGGLVQVLKAIPVDRVITNGQIHTTSTYEHFLDAIASAKAEYLEVKRGDTISLGSLIFDVLSPESITGDDLNNNSVVLHLVYGKTSFLFTGDAQAAAEASVLSSGLDVSANILKVAHHGSRTSSTPAFLNAVKPQVAIYSAGKGNDYGHPHVETLAALRSVGATIYGTDVSGTIIVTSDGNSYTIETAKEAQVQAPPAAIPTSEQPKNPEINVVSLTSPIAPGGSARLSIKTAPGANCSITVYYKSGPSQAQGLGPQTADANGNVTWSWKVGSRTTRGTWKIVVTADVNGQTISIDIPFEVQ